MADILPLNIPPPVIPAAPQPFPPDNVAVVTATIIELPSNIEQLLRPMQLKGVITTLLENGNLSLRTPAGDFTLNIPTTINGKPNPIAELLTPLVENQRPISLVIQSGSPPTQAILLLPQIASTPLNTAQSLNAPTTKLNAPAIAGIIFSAVVLPETTTIAAATNPYVITSEMQLPSAPANATTKIQFIPASPETTPQQSGEATKTTTPVIATPDTQQKLRAGSEVNFRINSIIPQESDATAPQNNAQFSATVIEKGAGGQLLMKVGDNTVFVRQNIDLPIGSKLTLTLLPAKQSEDYTIPINRENVASALGHLMTTLNQLDPQFAQHLMQSRIPQPNAAMPETLLFLFSALQQGNIKDWLGNDATGKLERAGKKELISKFIEDLQQASFTARDTIVGGWKSFPIPIHDGSQFQMLHLYVHKDNDEQRQTESGKPVSLKTRFIINLNMTKLGAMQIDGLSQMKQLDMVIRSDNPLPHHLPNELREIYVKTLEAVGLSGSIIFQNGKQNWMALQRETKSPMAGVVT